MAERILLVEDDPTLRATLTYRLQHEGYTVEAVSDGDRAIDSACKKPPQLILLDLMLPGTDGLTVCRKLRACCAPSQRIPIIMVTARVEESDIVVGLEAGADDYVTKPFSWMALRARIRAQLRRTQTEEADEEEKLGSLESTDVHIDLDAHSVTRAGIPIDLTNRLFDLLVYFVRHRGMVLTRSRLLERVWGFDYLGDSNTVNVHVHWLREKLAVDPTAPNLIQTVRGVGYRFLG
ncbi:MAG: response regulator transcription factor [Ktedonobacterales bacterium]|nr:response regulator transcription factor [Ktedonobacterales bacterium]